jgi:hypothetical protein
MAMSILLAQQKKLRDLEQKLTEALWEKTCAKKPSKSPFDKP